MVYREVSFIKKCVDMGDFIKSAGLVGCDLVGIDGYECWVTFDVEPSRKIWISSQRNKLAARKFKKLDTAVQVLKMLGVRKIELLCV